MSNLPTKPTLKSVEFAGMPLDEIKQTLITRIKERTSKWNTLTVAYFEAYAADVASYVKYGFDGGELGLSENEYELLRLISEGKFSAKGIPLVIKNVRVARELKILSLDQQEEVFNNGTIEIVRNHTPMRVKLADAKPTEVRRAIKVEVGEVKLLSATEQLDIIDIKPSSSHKYIVEFGHEENISILEITKQKGISVSTYLRQIALEKIKQV